MKGKLQPLRACRWSGYFPALCFTWGSLGTFLTPPPPPGRSLTPFSLKSAFAFLLFLLLLLCPFFFPPPPVGLRSEPKLRVQGPPSMQPLTLY